MTDFNAAELDFYARLSENQLLHYYEPEKGLFIAESPKVIERALNAGYEPISMLVEEKHISTQAEGIINLCGNIPVYTAELDVLTQLTGFQLTRGALCLMRRKNLLSVEEVCKNATRVAVLENVVNPTNVGAIFRNAAALGMDAVLLTNGCSDPLYRRSARVSMGTVFQIPWTFCDNTYVDTLKASGFKTVAMALCENSININNPQIISEQKLAVILGTEGDGLAESTITNCDYTVCIPMAHGVDSLNVAAASALAFWELGNNR
ncbi:MAG: RNA methyltransferase [Oscillospiraceae bacterium]|nr:RNA methyltransferase [Oscillospiraceae bacterium]